MLNTQKNTSLVNQISNTKYCGHPFHIVQPSPWPFAAAIAAGLFMAGLISYFWAEPLGFYARILGIILLTYILFSWFKDILNEAAAGHHTLAVQKNLRLGFILFLVSELRLFFSFFWAFFHSALSPTIWIGCAWPPEGISVRDPWGFPLFNTLILLTSGLFLTAAHKAICFGSAHTAVARLFITRCFGAEFLQIQVYEFLDAPFSISDGIFGSTFYILTGLHFSHVLAGLIFLFVGFYRLTCRGDVSKEHHFGIEAAIWYWHFVDVVWIFLYLVLYIWGR